MMLRTRRLLVLFSFDVDPVPIVLYVRDANGCVDFPINSD
jgi:hypothetical protein